ncbi:TPA: tail fiber protein [Citrobacter amalonaticus]|nr:tail fiber protein [Citrobacter amalonaticus]
MWYREGTITFTQGSDALTGTGTFWNVSANGVLPGMIVIGPDNKLHEIKRVINDTSLILVEPYTGETQTDVPCRIITTYEGDLTQFSARFTALMNRMSGDAKAMRSWLTAVDDVTLEREDGTEMTVKPLIQIVDEHNASQQWFKDNTDAIDAAGDKAKAAAASAAAAAESESKASSKADESAASASTATTKAQESATSAAAASQSEQTALDAATRAESSAASSDSAATRAETAAAKAEEIAVDIGLVDASLTQKGIVKLSNDTGSESESLAATPKAVKAANDNANSRVPATRKVNGHSLDTDVTIENVETANKLKMPVYVCVNLASKESASFDGSANATPGVSGVLGVENGGTGGATPEESRAKLDVPANADVFLKSDNLQGIADRAAAWLNVRPIGATPLGGDPVNDFDATTKRWVENLVGAGGGVGPTMNGVQNFGIGERTLWDSRAFIPAWAVPADGQLLKRDEWPELWAHAQMHSPIVDSDWLAAPANRGRWSRGDGSTTFRCPDLNGVQDGSIIGLYGRGDAGGKYIVGSVMENGAPNITGSTATSSITGYNASAPERGTGFVVPKAVIASQLKWGVSGSAGPTVTYFQELSFDASRSNKAYGRGSDVRPNSFVGVWIIRASGGFTAANTQWNVINEREEEAPEGVWSIGGSVRSVHKVKGEETAACAMYVNTMTDSAGYRNARMTFSISNKKGNEYSLIIAENGRISTSSGGFSLNGSVATTGAIITSSVFETNFVNPQTPAIRIAPKEASAAYIQALVAGSAKWYIGRPTATVDDLVIYNYPLNTQVLFQTNGFRCNKAMLATAFTPTSDRRTKSLIEIIPDPLNVMKSLRGYSWYYDADGRQGFGFMADEAKQFFKGAVTVSEGKKLMADGTEIEDVESVDTYGIAAALHHEAILALMGELESLKTEVADLKSRLNDKESASSSV